LRARKRQRDAIGPLILGVDPASNGGDRFSVAARRGQKVMWVRHRNKINHLEAVAWIRSLIEELNPARVNIDAGNIGAALVTSLKSINGHYAEIVRGVNFGGTSEAKMAKPKVPGPKDRRAEMWARMRDWLLSDEGASVPDMDALQTDICAPRLVPELNNDFRLERKVDMKKRGVRSPDLADSVALTFAFREFFTHYQAQDASTAQFGSPDTLPTQADTVYNLPPVAGPQGWMG
jgi:hypothetical protein